MSFISKKYGQFDYFDCQIDHAQWRGRTVLDFGGNVGNLLAGAGDAIDHHRYWCIDISRDAIDLGRKSYPAANWVFYDRYNYCFNPTGTRGLAIPDVGVEFDYILAYSVFTHTSLEEFRELVSVLESRLKPGGTLAFTFIDPHFHSWPDTRRGSNLRYRLDRIKEGNPSLDVDAVLARADGAERCVLVNDESLWVNDNPELPLSPGSTGTHHVFYTAPFMQAVFPRASIHLPKNREMQHCCILRAARR